VGLCCIIHIFAWFAGLMGREGGSNYGRDDAVSDRCLGAEEVLAHGSLHPLIDPVREKK